MRLFKVPKYAKFIYSKRVWGLSHSNNTIFLTFDDGPHPDITPFVLDTLKTENVKATFFCVGENVVKHPEIFERIKAEGHQIGNHSFKHENANKVNDSIYLDSIFQADKVIRSELFRPPYGRLSPKLARIISKDYKIIMWTWLSYDYDAAVSVDEILKKASLIKSGDVLVLHDNPKIVEKQKILLPKLIRLLKAKNFNFGIID
jgi:peptidoglycan/xylan/chitin deacetylase (PgdA/CDA1 family)